MGLLADDIKAETEANDWERCHTCEWLATGVLDADDVAEMYRWIDEGRSIAALWRLLKKRGLPASVDAFRRLHVRERHGRG